MLRQISRDRPLAWLLALTTLLLIGLALHQRHAAQAAPPLALILPRPDLARPRIKRGLDWARVTRDGAGYVQVFADGGRAELSLDPRLQELTERTLAAHPTPYAAAVLLSVDDGRVLAMAGRSTAEPALGA